MKNIVSSLFIVIGLCLIGYGSFNFFEKYDEYLETKDEVVIAGTYVQDENYAIVNLESNNNLTISLNDEVYEFYFDGEKYENGILGMIADFKDDKLILYKDGEEVGNYLKQKK